MQIQIFCFCLLLGLSSASVYSISPCNSTTYFNSVSMACLPCPSDNQVPNFTQCLCKPGFTPNLSNTISFNFTCQNNSLSCSSTDIFLEANSQGLILSSPTCIQNCSGASLPNSNRSACIYCGVGTNVTNGTCTCVNSSYTKGIGGCYNLGSWKIDRTSVYWQYIPNNLAGCLRDNSQLQCSALINICVYSLLMDAVCSQSQFASLLYVNQSSYSASATAPTDIMLVSYLPSGNYVDSQPFSLSDISNCPTVSPYSFSVGSNYKQACSFSFNNVLETLISRETTAFMYALLISDSGSNGTYYTVPVEMTVNGQAQKVQRFFTADTFSIPLTKQLTVLTSFDLQLTMDSNNQIVTPKLVVGYQQLSINQAGTLDNPIQVVSYSVNYYHSTSTFDKVALALLIVSTILAIIQAVCRTYIAYVNKRSPFIFFIYFGESWSGWMFFLLLGLTGYWFFFTKGAVQLSTLLPATGGLYSAFYAVVSLMVIIRVVSILWIKADTYKTEIFLIDWEVSPLKNCWREIFIANCLSEFYTFRTISFGWIVITSLFFIVGLGWENIGRSNTSLVTWSIFSEKNSILLYFIGCSVLFAVGSIIKVGRKVLITWWPHPFDDFVDFCCLANVSVYFPRRHSSVGYYIHGSNSSGSEISLMQLNQAILKGKLRRSHSLFNPGVVANEANTFILYANSQLEHKLNQLRRDEEQVSYDSRKKGYSNLFKNRQNFVNSDLKRILINLPKERNQLLQRNNVQEYLGIPPIDLFAKRDQIALAADSNSGIQDIFPNSDEFGDLITYCIIFGGLNAGFKSSSISAFLTYLLMEWILHPILNKISRVHIESSTKVKQGFML